MCLASLDNQLRKFTQDWRPPLFCCVASRPLKSKLWRCVLVADPVEIVERKIGDAGTANMYYVHYTDCKYLVLELLWSYCSNGVCVARFSLRQLNRSVRAELDPVLREDVGFADDKRLDEWVGEDRLKPATEATLQTFPSIAPQLPG